MISNGAGSRGWNERSLQVLSRDLLDSDPERGVVVLGLDGRAVYSNGAARSLLRDGTPRGRDPLLPARVDQWLAAYAERMRAARHPPAVEVHYPDDADRRLRLGFEAFEVDGLPHVVLRVQSAVPWAEPTVRRLQARFGLTVREAQVAAGVARGLTNSEVAEKLGIVEKTVKNVLMSVYSKCTVRNRVELALRAFDAPLGAGAAGPHVSLRG